MNDIKSFFDILSKFTIKDIGLHLKNLADLYVRPKDTWKKVISYRNTSYDFFILVIIYYSFVLFFSLSNIKYVIPLAILDVILTIFPFSFLYLPFIFYRKKFGKKIKANRLFRFLFVLKIQLNFLILVFIYFYKWASMESVFLIIENFIWIIFLAFIGVFPMLMKISFWRKVAWVITNYIFSLVYLIILGLILSIIPDSYKLVDKMSVKSPNKEYLEFIYQYEFSDILLDEEYYLINLHENNDTVEFRNTQFTTTRLALKFSETKLSEVKEEKRILESMIQAKKNNILFKTLDIDTIRITTKYLDSIKENFQSNFYKDLKLTDSLRNAATFNSNRQFYILLNEQLKEYDSLYTAINAVKDRLSNEPKFIIESDKNNLLFLTELDSETIKTRVEKIDVLREKFIKRREHSILFQRIYTYPVDQIIQLLNK